MPAAGISAGAFEVTDKKRIPKPPIVAMAFTLENEPEPISAQIVGAPNSDNGIRAVLETEPAHKLFTAFSDATVINVTLGYLGGASDHLIIRGWHDMDVLHRGQNSLFNQCLQGFTPSGSLRRIQ